MKSVQPTEYIHQQFVNFEKITRMFMEVGAELSFLLDYIYFFQMEAKLGVQANSYYIFDMEGLSFDPSLLPVVAGKQNNCAYCFHSFHRP